MQLFTSLSNGSWKLNNRNMYMAKNTATVRENSLKNFQFSIFLGGIRFWLTMGGVVVKNSPFSAYVVYV